MTTIETVIRNGRIVDGTGNPWFYGDVALAGDRIVAVTPRMLPTDGMEQVDASGMVVCPGFIDIQSHSIVPLMIDGRCLSKITQGVTTEIMGEAWTPAPFGGKLREPIPEAFSTHAPPEWKEKAGGWRRFADWLETLVARGVSPNVGSFLGGGTLRAYAKGMEVGPANPEELATMRRVMAEAMEDGAFGVSFALVYPPDAFVDTDELVEVSKVVARYAGLYITHLRSESDDVLDAVDEAIEIGRRAELPVEIYHLKADGEPNWHKIPEVIARIDRARAVGIDVTADMYPYPACGTGLASVLPPWAAADDRFLENLRNPEMRARIREEALHPAGNWDAFAQTCGPEAIMPIGLERPENMHFRGMRLSEIAALRNQHWIDAAIDLLISEERGIETIYFTMSEDNLALQLRQPWIKISSDAGGYDPAWAAALGPTHPRAYGTYPRVLGKYVREERIIPLEDAIRKMTSAVADRLGLRHRGQLRTGHHADVVIFDPQTVGDRATFEAPHQLAVGVRDVWVNGVRVLRDGAHTGAMPGRFVRGTGPRIRSSDLRVRDAPAGRATSPARGRSLTSAGEVGVPSGSPGIR